MVESSRGAESKLRAPLFCVGGNCRDPAPAPDSVAGEVAWYRFGVSATRMPPSTRVDLGSEIGI